MVLNMDIPITKISKSLIPLLIVTGVLILVPYNKFEYIKSDTGEIKLTKVNRQSLLFDLGIFFTPGEYKNILKKPLQYVNPILVNTVFDKGFYKIYAEFKGDTVIIYPETYCRSKNLDKTFYLKRVQNFGEFTWLDLKNDTTGKFRVLSNM